MRSAWVRGLNGKRRRPVLDGGCRKPATHLDTATRAWDTSVDLNASAAALYTIAHGSCSWPPLDVVSDKRRQSHGLNEQSTRPPSATSHCIQPS
jgi:hypothetical protein